MKTYWRDLEPEEAIKEGDRAYVSGVRWLYVTEDNITSLTSLIADVGGLPVQRKASCVPPIENGTNRYGLDAAYFREAINRELNRGLQDYKPCELARVLARLSVTADDSVIHEPEFYRSEK